MYPGYTGGYPRMQLWHGATDTTLAYPNFGEEIKQWTNLHGLEPDPVVHRPSAVELDADPVRRHRHPGDRRRASASRSRLHQLPLAGQIAYAISFLGLDGGPAARPAALVARRRARPTSVVGASPAGVWTCRTRARATARRSSCGTASGGSNQRWTYTSAKQLPVVRQQVPGRLGRGTANGTAVIIWDCNGQANQQWNVNANGTITGVQSGLCLDAYGAGTANGTKIILWSCSGGSNQQWSLRGWAAASAALVQWKRDRSMASAMACWPAMFGCRWSAW